MAIKKDDNSQLSNTPKYLSLHIPRSEDYPAIARSFAKIQIIAGAVASKMSGLFNGFYINSIDEEWRVIPKEHPSVGDDIYELRFRFRFTSRNKKVFQQLVDLQSLDSEILSSDDILPERVVGE